jgi:uncharacterized protein
VSRRRAFLEMVLVFAAFYLSGYVGQGAAASGGLSDTRGAMLSLVIYGAPQVFLLLYIMVVQRDPPLEGFGVVPLARKDLLRVPAVFLGAFAVLLPLLAAAALVPSAHDLLSRGYRWRLASAKMLPLAFVFAIVGGYREELFFRSYLITRMGQAGLPAAWAAASASALFSLGHWYEGPMGIAFAALLGVYFSVVFLRTRSLHVVAIAHGLYNFAVLTVSLFASSLLPG